MQILRIPPYPLSVSYEVPEPDTDYIITIENSPKTIEVQDVVTSDANAQIEYILTGDFVKYDHNYALLIYEKDGDSFGDIVVEDVLNITKPYVNPYKLGTTASEIAEYKEHEQLARGLIDSVVGPKGFMFEKAVLETVGQGTDYLPLWDQGYKVLQVYENAQLVYDVNQDPPNLGDYVYGITQDKSAIYKDFAMGNTEYNRFEKRPMKLPRGYSDSYNNSTPVDATHTILPDQGVMFPEGVDYLVIYEAGWKVIPHDVEDAARRLVEDIKCGNLEYMKNYILRYQTDQFQMEFDPTITFLTGNGYVDKILQRYVVSIYKPGIF